MGYGGEEEVADSGGKSAEASCSSVWGKLGDLQLRGGVRILIWDLGSICLRERVSHGGG